jgi:hypothetical protein
MPLSNTTRPRLLDDLAPARLSNDRAERFDGSGFSSPLSAFSPAQQGALKVIYESVTSVDASWRDRGPEGVTAVREQLANLDTQRLSAAASALSGKHSDPAIGRIIHDIRGGGLCLLLGAAELIREGWFEDDMIRSSVGAARDHAKMMRAVLPEIDPERFAIDEANRVHGTDGVVAAFDGLRVSQLGREISVAVHCEYHGGISARCLEIAALDRVVYSLVNNAVRFSAGDTVELFIFLVDGSLTRWVVRNAITADQRDWLEQNARDELGELFSGGVSRGGTKVGLSNCAEVVAACFGLSSPLEAVRGKYVGAKATDTDFYAWFHWPTCPSAR